MPDELPPPLSQSPCTLSQGLLGRRGQLALYSDQVLYIPSDVSRALGVVEFSLLLEDLRELELQGRGRNRLVLRGTDEQELRVKMGEAAGFLHDVCQLLVPLRPTPPEVDTRFGSIDKQAAAAFFLPRGVSLEGGEELLLCEWALAWSGDDLVRCGWLALSSHRIFFLPEGMGIEGDGGGHPEPQIYYPGLIERVSPSELTAGQLWFVAGRKRLRFDPFGGGSFVEQFWEHCDAPLHGTDEGQVRRGQPLSRVAGRARFLRLARTGGEEFLLHDLWLDVHRGRLWGKPRASEVQGLEQGEHGVVEVGRRTGLYRFQGVVSRLDPVADGPFKPSHVILELALRSDVRFVNRRRAYRVDVNIPVQVKVFLQDEQGRWKTRHTARGRIVDLSNGGCAIIGPRNIPEQARLVFDLPLTAEGEREELDLKAECVHLMGLPETKLNKRYGLAFVELRKGQRDKLQQEVVRQERSALQRNAAVRRWTRLKDG